MMSLTTIILQQADIIIVRATHGMKASSIHDALPIELELDRHGARFVCQVYVLPDDPRHGRLLTHDDSLDLLCQRYRMPVALYDAITGTVRDQGNLLLSPDFRAYAFLQRGEWYCERVMKTCATFRARLEAFAGVPASGTEQEEPDAPLHLDVIPLVEARVIYPNMEPRTQRVYGITRTAGGLYQARTRDLRTGSSIPVWSQRNVGPFYEACAWRDLQHKRTR